MPSNLPEHNAVQVFRERFGASAAVLTRAPGRVELLGNHTDYNGGLVLAAAIDRFTAVAGRALPGGEARVHSIEFGADDRFSVSNPEKGEAGSWGRYVRGVAWALGEAYGVQSGFEAVVTGDVPLGAGLSSSASLQAAVGMFLIASGAVGDPFSGNSAPRSAPDHDEARMRLARTLQRSENQFVGVGSGLLDQFTVLFGRAGEALVLDCRSLAFERLPLGFVPPALVVCDSKTSRRLADGMYNKRRAECEAVVDYFRTLKGADSVHTLRDVSLDDMADAWDRLDPVARLRARHVLTENQRVSDGALALRRHDVAAFGRLMSASHASSRDDFGNSSPALDALIDAAAESPGFLGGKLSGAGWAGCTINLVASDQAEDFARSVSAGYARRTGVVPDVHICHAADGAGAIDL